MEVLLLFALLLPVIVLAVAFCIFPAMFLVPCILFMLPVAIPMWILAAPSALSREREPGR